MNSSEDSKPTNAVKLNTFSAKFEVLTGLGGIVLGLGFLLGVGILNELTESAVKTQWYSCLILPMLFIGLGLFFGGGRNLIRMFDYSVRTYKNNPPFQKIICTNCNQVVQVNVRQFEFTCRNCDASLNYSPYGNNLNVDPDLTQYRTLLQSISCSKCKSPNSILDRPLWFTCPNCKSRVELEEIPLGILNIQSQEDRTVDPAELDRKRIEKLGIELAICPNCGTMNSLSVIRCEKCNENLDKVKPIRNPYL